MGDRATALIDDEQWPPIYEAIRASKRSIALSQLLFEPDFAPIGRPLADELEDAARRGVRVRILLNENAALPDSYDDVRQRFEDTPVEVQRMLMTPNVLHAKLLVIDGETAFLVDPPFEQKYVDLRIHPFRSRRRRQRPPLHSVSVRLHGPIVAQLARVYEALWTRDGLQLPRAAATKGARIALSAPEGIFGQDAVGEILDEYERAIASARRFVYLETQYFTSPRIASAIADALERAPELEVILVANEHMDVPTYDAWQARRLEELGAGMHPRLGVFSVWSSRRSALAPALRPTYVHSKVAIVDDTWMTIGSANLDSLSLHEAEEFGVPMSRNIDANVVLHGPIAASVRRRLWGEHLADAGVWRQGIPPEGWLALWRRIAEENLARVRSGGLFARGHVLPLGALGTKTQVGGFPHGDARA